MRGAPGCAYGAVALALTALCAAPPLRVSAHSGPPFPIVSNHTAGPYQVSVWTDPDATDDGTEGGQFWVVLRLPNGAALPPDTQAVVTITPLDRPGPSRSAPAAPVQGDLSRQFAAVLMDHEGRFAVQTSISGSRGAAVVDAEVEATYDLRPQPILLAVYLLPFVIVGLFWLKLLRHRRGMGVRPSRAAEKA